MYYLALEKLIPAKNSGNISYTLSLFHCVPEDCRVYRTEILLSPGHPATAAKIGDIMKGTSCM
jgi:hypothetical protein